MARRLSKSAGPAPMLVVNARQKGTGPGDTAPGGARFVRVPVGEALNGGEGVHYYLRKRDEASGKPIFYSPEVWSSMNDLQRAEARDFKPVENESHKATAANLLNAFVAADPLAKKALTDMVAQQVRAQIEAEMKAQQPVKGGAR